MPRWNATSLYRADRHRSPVFSRWYRRRPTGLATLLVLVLYGCSGSPDAEWAEGNAWGKAENGALGVEEPVLDPVALEARQFSEAGGVITDIPAATTIDARPAALINGRAVSWGHLRPLMTEAAGGLALEELVMETQIRRALADSGRIISEGDVDAERERLLRSLHDDRDTAARLLRDLRLRRNLGSRRFQAMLWRKAALRALVADRVTVSDGQVEQMYRVIHGERRQARIVTANSLRDAEAAMRRLDAGEPFAKVAAEVSTDVSAARGGLLAAISPDDPAYPQLYRQTLAGLGVGQRSSPLLIDGQYVIMQLEEVAPATGTPLSEVRGELIDLAREQESQALMDRVAAQMLSDASVRIFDPALLESWGTRR